MESLSPSQIRDINSLYNKMYEPEGELVERYLSEDEIRLNYAYALSESKAFNSIKNYRGAFFRDILEKPTPDLYQK